MKKTQIAARISVCICLLLALFTVLLCGIGFVDIPGLFSYDELYLSEHFARVYCVKLENHSPDAYNILSARIDALPYDDLKLTQTGKGQFTLSIPRRLSANAKTLANLISAHGVIEFEDTKGDELIPRNAVTSATVGFGQMDPDSARSSYFLEFFLNEEYRSEFTEQTRALSTRQNGENVFNVILDGNTILQASVTEAMTGNSFMIGGYFADSTLPTLYASFINNGELNLESTISDVEEQAPRLFTGAYALLWAGALVFALLLGAVFLLFQKNIALAAHAVLLFSTLCMPLPYLFLNLRISLFTFIGIFLSVIFCFLLQILFSAQIKKEIALGKMITSALEATPKNTCVKYYICCAASVVCTAVFLALCTGFSPAWHDLAIPLFFTACLETVFGYVFTAFLYKTSALFISK